jgi:hypothetical protein
VTNTVADNSLDLPYQIITNVNNVNVIMKGRSLHQRRKMPQKNGIYHIINFMWEKPEH